MKTIGPLGRWLLAIVLLCGLSANEIGATRHVQHRSVHSTIESTIRSSLQEKHDEMMLAAATASANADMTVRTPVPVHPLQTGEKPPAFVEMAVGDGPTPDGRNGHPCKAGFGCIYPNGVCCAGGEVCCELSCTTDNPPQCGKSPAQVALDLAREKMAEEGNKEIQSEHYQKTRAGAKARLLKEIATKRANEQNLKKKQLAQEHREKKKKEADEAAVKNEISQKENKWKQNEHKQKAVQERKRKAEEQRSKVLVIQPDNYEPKKDSIVAPANRFLFTGKVTYLFWVRPSGVQDELLSNLFFKGSHAGERSPAVFFYPGQLRLKIVSATQGNPNNALDPEEQLPLHQWTHVAITHGPGEMKVYLNSKLKAESHVPEPVSNEGPMYSSAPWYPPALCHMSDFRYIPRVITATEITEVYRAKQYQEIKSSSVVLFLNSQKPRKGQQVAPGSRVKRSSSVTWMFWIRPRGVIHKWANIFQKGAKKPNRQISVSFYPGSTRLHVRSATQRGINDGADPEAELDVWKWTHVAITHKQGEFVVYYNGVEAIRADLPQPIHNGEPVYFSEPYLYDAADCDVAQLIYADNAMELVEVRAVMEKKMYDKNPPHLVKIATEEFRPSSNNLLITGAKLGIELTAYTWTFWIKPMGTIPNEWSEILHKGDADAQRNLAIWFYPGSTRLHIRSGTKSSYNDGLDPVQALAQDTWTHVAIVHMHSRMEVWYNGVSQASEWKWQPTENSGSLRAASEFYKPALCSLTDLRMYRGVITQKDIEDIVAENKKGG